MIANKTLLLQVGLSVYLHINGNKWKYRPKSNEQIEFNVLLVFWLSEALNKRVYLLPRRNKKLSNQINNPLTSSELQEHRSRQEVSDSVS